MFTSESNPDELQVDIDFLLLRKPNFAKEVKNRFLGNQKPVCTAPRKILEKNQNKHMIDKK